MSGSDSPFCWPDDPYWQADIWMKHEDLQRQWPYGPPAFHEACCMLHSGATACDCKASDQSEAEWGWGSGSLPDSL